MNKSLLSVAAVTGVTALALSVPALAPNLSTHLLPAPTAAPTATSTAPQTSTATTTGTASTTGTTAATQASGVVLILATTTSGEAAGTGMVLTADGQVLTNYHVVEGSTSLEVNIPATGGSYTATVLGHDAAADVALLQLQDASGLATITPDDDVLAVGDALTAVGNAQGGGRLVAASGTVTALGQQVTVSGADGSPETLTGVIQTDAAAQPGDSGGPMFDAEGEVAGMTTAGSQTVTAGRRGRSMPVTTVSYAVPIDAALDVVAQIRTGQDQGSTEVGPRAYLGITVTGASGVTVGSVVADGPAASAGLTAGSTITAVDGQAVTSQASLSAILEQLEPGQAVAVTWTDSGGVRRNAKVTLGTSPIN